LEENLSVSGIIPPKNLYESSGHEVSIVDTWVDERGLILKFKNSWGKKWCAKGYGVMT